MAELNYPYIGELVLRAQEGDSDAFAELYVATYQQQYRFSYRYLQDEFLAQDALQETYILALKNITTLRDSHVFVSWLNQINMRVCFDIYRREKRQNQELDRYEQLRNGARAARRRTSPSGRISMTTSSARSWRCRSRNPRPFCCGISGT